LRPALAALAFLTAVSIAPIAPVHADPPEVRELGPVYIRARGPRVFTTIARARPEDRTPELRADLVREVPRTVHRAPF
jgi:hypothetical protein